MLQQIIKRYSPFPSQIKQKTFLFFGAGGFIGTHALCMLIRSNVKVISLSRNELPIKAIERLYGLKSHDMGPHYKTSIYSQDTVKNILEKHMPDIVINFAYSDISKRNKSHLSDSINSEIMPFVSFLEALGDAEIAVLLGTCEEYGHNPPPFKEIQKEDPVSVYSLTKTMQYYLVKYLCKLKKLNYLYIRPFTTYGPLQKSTMFVSSAITAFLKRQPFVMSEGYQKREFNFVTDTAYNIILSSLCPEIRNSIINIGSGISFRMRDIASLIRDMTDPAQSIYFDKSLNREMEIRDLVSDISMMKRYLSEPAVELEEGLGITIQYYREAFSHA